MLNIRNYLEDIKYVINTNSPAQLKMFAFRYQQDAPHLKSLLELDRSALKLYLHYMKKEVLPQIEEHLDDMDDSFSEYKWSDNQPKH